MVIASLSHRRTDFHGASMVSTRATVMSTPGVVLSDHSWSSVRPTLEASVLGLLAFTGASLNIIVLITVIGSSSRLRHRNLVTTGNLVLIGHLTFVGAFVALVVLPVASVAALNPRWISKLPCSFYAFVCSTLNFVSIWNITLIAWDKHQSIAKPLRYASFMTVKRASMCLLLLWVAGMSAAAINLMTLNIYQDPGDVNATLPNKPETLFRKPVAPLHRPEAPLQNPKAPLHRPEAPLRKSETSLQVSPKTQSHASGDQAPGKAAKASFHPNSVLLSSTSPLRPQLPKSSRDKRPLVSSFRSTVPTMRSPTTDPSFISDSSFSTEFVLQMIHPLPPLTHYSCVIRPSPRSLHLSWGFFTFHLLLSYVLPFAFLLYCYIHIFLIARSQSKKITMVIHLISLLQMPIAREMKKSSLHQVFQGHKAMITIVLVLGSFTLNFFPHWLLISLRSMTSLADATSAIPTQVDAVAIFLFYAYPTTNAIVYGLKERFLKDQIQAWIQKYLVQRAWRKEVRKASRLYQEHMLMKSNSQLRHSSPSTQQSLLLHSTSQPNLDRGLLSPDLQSAPHLKLSQPNLLAPCPSPAAHQFRSSSVSSRGSVPDCDSEFGFLLPYIPEINMNNGSAVALLSSSSTTDLQPLQEETSADQDTTDDSKNSNKTMPQVIYNNHFTNGKTNRCSIIITDDENNSFRGSDIF